MANTVRVRFAPSPTGPLHIGGVRTALFNYLFAKQHGGHFVLRIEDTDQNRYVEGAENYIKEALDWCGIPYDEGPGKDGGYGPYRQSERKHLYKQYALQLIESGHAYYAFDSSEQLDHHRKDHEAKGKTFIYNWHNREKLTNALSLSEEEVQQRLLSGEPYVIRFKSPQDETLVLNDIIRGNITIDTNVLDDKILFKSDGMPTYHLANIVDDHLMQITHVIRGEEWLPSLALHQLLYNAFGWQAPKFAHLPLIMKPTGKGKLNKRDGEKGGFPVFPLSWNTSEGYREAGYFPESVLNFLAFLGWNPGTEQELFALEELIANFSLERVNKSGARFDPDKTKWFNQQWLQRYDNETLSESFTEILKARGVSDDLLQNDHVAKVVALIKERAIFTEDLWPLGSYFFVAPETYNEKAVKKQFKEGTSTILTNLVKVIENIEGFTQDNIQDTLRSWITDNSLPFGKVMGPLRLCLVGDVKGPDLFALIALIGKTETLQRIEKALASLA